MIDCSKELRKQLGEIDRLIAQIKAGEKEAKGLPVGKIRVSSSHGKQQYYFRERDREEERYVSVKEMSFIKKMIQREHERKVEKKLQSMKNEIKHFLDVYDPKFEEQIYEGLCEVKKSMVTPMEMTDAMFIEEWYALNAGGQNTFPETGVYETERGETVRSKSEKIIADTMNRMKVPYQYEPQLRLVGNKVFYPDFVCLNVAKRKTFYWEHLGLMQSNEYAAKNCLKLEHYEKNGILMGENLIVSLESVDYPLDVGLIRKKIELFLL